MPELGADWTSKESDVNEILASALIGAVIAILIIGAIALHRSIRSARIRRGTLPEDRRDFEEQALLSAVYAASRGPDS